MYLIIMRHNFDLITSLEGTTRASIFKACFVKISQLSRNLMTSNYTDSYLLSPTARNWITFWCKNMECIRTKVGFHDRTSDCAKLKVVSLFPFCSYPILIVIKHGWGRCQSKFKLVHNKIS